MKPMALYLFKKRTGSETGDNQEMFVMRCQFCNRLHNEYIAAQLLTRAAVARRAAVASFGLRKRLLLAGNCQWPRDRGQKALPLARERR